VAFSRAVDSDTTEGQEIWLVQPDGSDLVRLTDNDSQDDFPAWSPDRAWIAFGSMRGGDLDIYVMRPDGTEVTQVTNSPSGEAQPTWSPDGKWLAFTSDRTGGTDIYKARVSGGRAIRLTSGKAHDFDPEWSPDGGRIAFSRNHFTRHVYGIRTVKPDGSGLRAITNNPKAKNGYTDASPTWSPDGRRLAFMREHGRNEPFGDIYLIRRAGSGLGRLTDFGSYVAQPSWSSATEIVFTRNADLWRISLDGSGLAEVTTGDLPEYSPDW
jgi:TolB protein